MGQRRLLEEKSNPRGYQQAWGHQARCTSCELCPPEGQAQPRSDAPCRLSQLNCQGPWEFSDSLPALFLGPLRRTRQALLYSRRKTPGSAVNSLLVEFSSPTPGHRVAPELCPIDWIFPKFQHSLIMCIILSPAPRNGHGRGHLQ